MWGRDLIWLRNCLLKLKGSKYWNASRNGWLNASKNGGLNASTFIKINEINNGWDKGKWIWLNSGEFEAVRDNILRFKTYNLDCMKMRQRAENVEGNRKNGNCICKCSWWNNGATLNVGAWRSRMERNEVHADTKWQKELQKRQQLRWNASVE